LDNIFELIRSLLSCKYQNPTAFLLGIGIISHLSQL